MQILGGAQSLKSTYKSAFDTCGGYNQGKRISLRDFAEKFWRVLN